MAIAFFICVSCAGLGIPLVGNSAAALSAISSVRAQPAKVIARALVPGVLGLYFLSISAAFFLFTLIKVDVQWKEKHLTKFILVQSGGRAVLWFTAPVAVLWIIINLVASG